MPDASRNLADHEERSVQAIAAVYRQHARSAGWLQRIIETITALIGRPVAVIVFLMLVVLWMISNVSVAATGRSPIDAPPFGWLELAVSIVAVAFTMLILATQRRDDELEERRTQLTLQLALQADQKIAKVIALLEELRRDSPTLPDRDDPVSDEMSRPADTEVVLEEIQRRAPSSDDISKPDQKIDN